MKLVSDDRVVFIGSHYKNVFQFQHHALIAGTSNTSSARAQYEFLRTVRIMTFVYGYYVQPVV